MSWSGPGPTASSPNPINPPPLPHNRQEGGSNLIDAKWFIVGLLLVVVMIAGVVYLLVMTTHSAELDYAVLESELRAGTITSLTISGTDAHGDFLRTRQSYDGQVRGQGQPVPAGYSESNARPVTSFTTTIPDGEQEDIVQIARRNGVEVSLE